MTRPVPHIAAMSPYALASLNVAEGVPLTSLSQNESFRPPSPLIAEAGVSAMASAHLYPDPEWQALRDRLGTLHKIPAQNILCSNGSMELILSLALCYADPDHAVLAPTHAYPFFRITAQLARARFDTAFETPAGVSVDNLLAPVREDSWLFFVANPGNPTGTRIPRADLLRLRDGLPTSVILVIDEAYGEFADHLDEPMFDLVDQGNTEILRTFSKAYGLAGMRIGWGLFPPQIAQELRKVMNPNNISVAGQITAEVAAADQAYMRETCDQTAKLRDKFADRLRDAGLTVGTSFTNFVLLRFADPAQAQAADTALRAQGLVARAQAGAGLPNCLRLTISMAAEMDHAAKVLEDWTEGGMT